MKILVVDDSADVRQSLMQLLADTPGVESVEGAEDIAGATQAIHTQRPDIVILDIQLRGQERGMAVLRYVRRTRPGTLVAVLSNYSWAAMRDGFSRAGAAAYFDKGCEVGSLRAWIARRAEDAPSSTA